MIEVSICEAKQRLKETLQIYLQKTPAGRYVLPQNKQRPVYLEGPAGIGKTEIVRQAAEETGIGFVPYSMTHHSRQSAIGLPAIVEKDFGGKICKATEYTMSEIVGAVWSEKRRGHDEGILFADEVNCVSETLTAAMLQFLQNKTFGPHRIPEGWIIVAAGNPPEYNKSVRTFDAVTQDRLRTIRIKPDRSAWLDYAAKKGMHPIVIQYVREHADEFYSFSVEKGRQQIVTPRAWEDLSRILRLSEESGLMVDESLIAEFLQCEKTARGFFGYYQTLKALLTQEEVQVILSGQMDGRITAKIKGFSFQQRWASLLVLLSALEGELDRMLAKAEEDPAAGDEALSGARDRLDTLLAYLTETFGLGRETEIALNMLLENESVQRLSAYRRLEGLLALYRKLIEQRGETMRELRFWSRQSDQGGEQTCH